MRAWIATCLICLLQSAFAQRIAPTIDIKSIRLEITWVNHAELVRIRNRYERSATSVREGALGESRKRVHGFSILRRRDDGYTCELYVVRPEGVNDPATSTLGHELLHCLLGNYHP